MILTVAMMVWACIAILLSVFGIIYFRNEERMFVTPFIFMAVVAAVGVVLLVPTLRSEQQTLRREQQEGTEQKSVT